MDIEQDDRQLLRAYAQIRSQEAFRELVERHLGMVYATACRTTGDPHLAKDVAQSVFAILAKKADGLKHSQTLGGWLYNTTRYLAMRTNRAEQRRREREQAAASLSLDAPSATENTGQILEALEPAMAKLDESDRAVLVLRYFEDRSLRSVGSELEISEDAARMRINRALERLRSIFAQQDISISSACLATIMVSTAPSLPVGLAASVIAASSATAIATQAAFMTMTWFNTKTVSAIISAAVIAGTGTYWFQQSQILPLRATGEELRAHSLQLRTELTAAHELLQSQKAELERLKKDNSDLHRLRNEVAQLRRQSASIKPSPTTVSPPNFPPPPPALNPGRFISREELSFAGRETPEATIQSMTWAAVKGTIDETIANFTPELQQLLSDPRRREALELDRVSSQDHLQGMQVMARKSLGEDIVELKVKVEQNSAADPGNRRLPDLSIVKMVKVGDEWRFNQVTQTPPQEWDQSAGVQTLTQ